MNATDDKDTKHWNDEFYEAINVVDAMIKDIPKSNIETTEPAIYDELEHISGTANESGEIYPQLQELPQHGPSFSDILGRNIINPAMIYMNQTEIHADEPV